MKYLVSFLLAASMVAGGQALAQVDPDPDGIGIYADKAATINAITANAEPGEAIEVYLVLTRPSITAGDGDVVGWECKLVVPQNVTVWGWNIPGSGWLNVGAPPEFQVAYGHGGLPLSNAILLMTFIIHVTDTEPALFYIQPARWNSAQANLPAFVAAGDVNHCMPLHPYPAGPDQPSFKVNPGPTPVVAATWGEIKSLY